ncbi:MAG: S-layer homology domain-containing protein, partial [Candidatus Limnocylindrales bacterium]
MWVAPTDNGGSPISGYVVTSSPDGKTCTAMSPHCTVAELANEIAYIFTVVAQNAVGAGPSSDPSSSVTPSVNPRCAAEPFEDVSVDRPFCVEIAWMKDARISTGFSDNTYRPNAPVTRQAMAAFMSRLDGETPP